MDLTPLNVAAGQYDTTYTTPVNIDGNQTLNYCQTYPLGGPWPMYTYTWPPDYATRIATLEGEVKVLREMLAAVLRKAK